MKRKMETKMTAGMDEKIGKFCPECKKELSYEGSIDFAIRRAPFRIICRACGWEPNRNISKVLIKSLQAHALIIAECTRAQADIAAKTAENMQREALGQSMAYGYESFDEIKIPSQDSIVALFDEYSFCDIKHR